MDQNLQGLIAALAAFPVTPESAWVARVQNFPVEVIAGAMLTWVAQSGISIVTGDPMAPRRGAALAILQARLSEQALASSTQLRNTIDKYQQTSGRQTNVMLGLTIVITVLTAVQIWVTLRAASAC